MSNGSIQAKVDFFVESNWESQRVIYLNSLAALVRANARLTDLRNEDSGHLSPLAKDVIDEILSDLSRA